MIRLVALDIDGTLLDPGVPVDAMPGAEMTAAVSGLEARGIAVVLASGRMYPGTARVARHLGIERPLICQQGASIHHLDGSLRQAHMVDEAIAMELVEYTREHGWSLAWFDSRRYLTSRHTEQGQFFADVSGIPMEIDAEPHLSGIRPTGIDIISTVEHAAGVHNEMQARYGDQLTLLDFPSVTGFHAVDASKGNALETLAGELGIDASEVLAIGDSVNDVSMLKWAGQSATPAHCDDHARDAAKKILSGAGVSGIAELLRSL